MIPGYKRLHRFLQRRFPALGSNLFLRFAPPGSFYSPIPDLELIVKARNRIFERNVDRIPGIEIDDDEHRSLIREFSSYYKKLPFGDKTRQGLRYHFNNPYFSYGDAVALYSMIRHYSPKRIIEVGSGYSSAAMLDTNELFLKGEIVFTFIEPNPERLYSLLRDEERDKLKIITADVQNIPAETFDSLREKDILFIDSSHVVKTGSDVAYLLGTVLPALDKGVIIHFHDVFWPFEYPEEWVRGGRAWNEAYFLKAFLQYNSAFKVLFFNSYAAGRHGDLIGHHLPLFLKNPGGSLWITKTA